MYLVQRIQGGSGTRAPGSAPIRLQGASSLRFQALEQKSRLSGFQNTRFPVGSENVPRQTSFPWNDCWWQSSGVILVHLSKILLLLSPLRDGGHRGGAQVWQSPRSPCAPPLALTSRSVSNSPWRCALARLPTVTLMQSCVWVSNTPQCHTSAQVHRDGSLPLFPTTNASEQLLLLAPPPTSPCTVKVSVKGSLSLCHRPG